MGSATGRDEHALSVGQSNAELRTIRAEFDDFLKLTGPLYYVLVDDVEHPPPKNDGPIVSGATSYVAVFVPIECLSVVGERTATIVSEYLSQCPSRGRRSGTVHASKELRPGNRRAAAGATRFLAAQSDLLVEQQCHIFHFTIFKQELASGGRFRPLLDFPVRDNERGTAIRLKDRKRAALFVFAHGLERLVPRLLPNEGRFFVRVDRGVSPYDANHGLSDDWMIDGLSKHIFNGGLHFVDRNAEPLLVLPDVTAYVWAWFRKTFGAPENGPVVQLSMNAPLDQSGTALRAFLRRVAPIMQPLKAEAFLDFRPRG